MGKLTSLLWTIIISLISISAQSQLSNQETDIQVKYISEEIALDGLLDEEIWSKTIPISGMNQNFPNDSLKATNDTEFRFLYTDKTLYVGITCHAQGGNFVTTSLRRDYDFFGNDNITLLFDTYSDNTNALAFGMNAFGVRREATVAGAGQEGSGFDESWDNKWDGKAKMYDDKWTVEMAIPFSTLRFKDGTQKWRFNAYRVDTQSNEISVWTKIPRNRFVMDLGFMSDFVWEKPLKKIGRNISLIPYISGSTARDFEDPLQTSAKTKFNLGGDAKISVSSGLNLDLTFNPDFSQVEVDEQVSNLDRFEILFPEKRQFFLENADLFGSFGAGRVNPFFSRRIGLTIDTATGQNVQNTIIYGARLSGKINERLRLGVLNMQTASQEENGIPGFNYSVITGEQKISQSSRLGLMFVNKNTINGNDFDTQTFQKYNRTIGASYRLNSSDNKWTGAAVMMKSFSPHLRGNDYSNFGQLVYNQREFRAEMATVYIGNNFNPEVGFVPRKDILLISPEFSLNFFPKSGAIASHSIGFDSRFIYKLGKDDNPFLQDFGLEEIDIEPFWSAFLSDLSMIDVKANIRSIKLLRDFDPTRLQKDGVFLPAGNTYKFVEAEIAYQGNRNKKFIPEAAINFGTFYNGSAYGSSGGLTYRFQPYGFVALNYSYNYVKLAEPFIPKHIWLVGPRIDITFTKEIFLTTFIQYNNQLDNLNINTRFQYRFAPASDFFLVYTDNYITDPWADFSSRNKALVAKMTYWFNL